MKLASFLFFRSIRGPSVARAGTPLNGSVVGNGAVTPTTTIPTSGQFEGALLRNRNLGQDILPSPGQPKRTESLYVAPARGSAASGGSGGGAGMKVSLICTLFRVVFHPLTFIAMRSLHYSYYVSRILLLGSNNDQYFRILFSETPQKSRTSFFTFSLFFKYSENFDECV